MGCCIFRDDLSRHWSCTALCSSVHWLLLGFQRILQITGKYLTVAARLIIDLENFELKIFRWLNFG